ncbi:PAS domain S-box protein [Oleidesulfovibrio sp.]|uniref:PAS domain S-box protein n=1 Tax=Oleidesulfovibrio sp. TaxID=2909707 RepID=UPI003A8B596A
MTAADNFPFRHQPDTSTFCRSVLLSHGLRIAATLVLLCAFICIWSQPAAAQQDKRRNVLFLNSYHNGYSWSDKILEGVKNVFAEQDNYNVVLQVEYMDSKKFHYDDTVQTLFRLYRDKFRGKHFDAIICSDNIAFDFLQQFRDTLFPGVPVIFSGLNDFQIEGLKLDGYTGVTEEYDVVANLQLAMRLHPQMKRMVVIGDTSVTGTAIRNQIKRALSVVEGKLQVEFWTEYRLEDMLENVRRQGPDTFFYFIPMYRDIDGQFYSAQELLEKVHANSKAPLYSNWEFLLGHGILGGKLISGVRHGEVAAKIAMQILHGTPVDEIPIISAADAADSETYIFDYNELRRLFITPEQLPDGSKLINEPSPFYELNKQVFWTIIIFMVLLSASMVMLTMNILEKRRVEQKIKDQLSFLRLLMDTIPLPIFTKDKNGSFLQCNKAFEEFFNVDRESLLGLSGNPDNSAVLALTDPSDVRLLRRPNIEISDKTIEGPDGKLRNIILHKATHNNARGDIVGLVGVVFDYTARRRAEDSLRAAEEKYRSIFEGSPLGIFRIRPQDEFIDLNPSLARMAGYDSPEELAAELPVSVSRLVEKITEDNTGPNEVVDFEHTFAKPDGSNVTAHITLRVARDETGAISMLEGYAENVTQRKEAEQALSESQRMLQLVLDNIPQLVSWKDASLRYIGANKSFAQFFGIDELEGAIGRSDIEILPDEAQALRLRDEDEEVIRSNTPRYRYKWSTTAADGKSVWLETNRVPLHDEKGHVVGLLTTAEDVTQKINLERQLLQSQKMEAIGTLAGGISHDFNNILTSIINSIELALTDVEAASITFNDLMRALKAAQRGSHLVKQILTFSRPSVEGFVTTDINEALNEAASLIKASLPRNIDIRLAIPPRPSLTYADPTQIHQVIMNLCTNSFQALRETGGVLEINLEQEPLAEEAAQELAVSAGNYLKLTVSDDGPGIPLVIADKIFDPFFTTKGKTEGTGLGLAVVHGIVKAHRGAVRVTSEPFKRTAFEIWLPMLDAEGTPLPISDAGDLQGGDERILFVEDDDDQLHTIPRVLESLGFTVRALKSPSRAAQLLRENPRAYDLVITDYDMPETNGLELADEISDIAPHIPVIMVSGRDVVAEGAGAFPNIKAIVPKPYNRNILSETIRRVLG